MICVVICVVGVGYVCYNVDHCLAITNIGFTSCYVVVCFIFVVLYNVLRLLLHLSMIMQLL